MFCLHVYLHRVCLVPTGQKRGAGVTGECELPFGCWKLNLQEQRVLLSAELSLQPQYKCFPRAPADTESDTNLGGTASLFRLGDDKYSLHESTKPLRCPNRHASHTQFLFYSSYSSCLYEIGSPAQIQRNITVDGA